MAATKGSELAPAAGTRARGPLVEENLVVPKAGLAGGMNVLPDLPGPSLRAVSGGRMALVAARWERGGPWPVANPSVAVLTGANAALTAPVAMDLAVTAPGRRGVLGVRASAVPIVPMGIGLIPTARLESALSAVPTDAPRGREAVSSAPAFDRVVRPVVPSLARVARTTALADPSASNP